MSERKKGDKVWVQCEVVTVYKDRDFPYVDVEHDGTVFQAIKKQCRPVKPPAIEACTETANDQLRQSLMDYPFGEPTNCPEIPDSSSDPINPSHYKQGGIECIEAMKVALGGGFSGYLRGNTIKYLWRYDKKNGVEDLKKARWYLDRLIKEVGE